MNPVYGTAPKKAGKAYTAESKRKVMEAVLQAWIESDLSLGELLYHVIYPSFGSPRDIFKMKDSFLVARIVANVKMFNDIKLSTKK